MDGQEGAGLRSDVVGLKDGREEPMETYLLMETRIAVQVRPS